MGLQLHERTLHVQRARAKFGIWWLDFVEKHGLTQGEEIQMLSDEIQSITKYIIRAERHPDDPEKKGDEA